MNNNGTTDSMSFYSLDSQGAYTVFNGNNATQNFDFPINDVAVAVDDYQGNPVADASVQIDSQTTNAAATTNSNESFAGSGGEYMEEGATVASNGVAHLSVFPGATYSVTAYGSVGHTTSSLSVIFDTTPTIQLPAPSTLSGAVTFIDNGDGTTTLSGQASTTNQGYYFLTIMATSSAGTTSQNFVLTIDNVQSVPTFVSANNLTESFGVPFSYMVDTTGGPILNISKLSGGGNLPSGVILKDNNDGTATLSSELNKVSDSGVYTFTIKANNKSGTATQAFTLTITKTPVIASITNKTAYVGTTHNQSVSAGGNQLQI